MYAVVTTSTTTTTNTTTATTISCAVLTAARPTPQSGLGFGFAVASVHHVRDSNTAHRPALAVLVPGLLPVAGVTCIITEVVASVTAGVFAGVITEVVASVTAGVCAGVTSVITGVSVGIISVDDSIVIICGGESPYGVINIAVVITIASYNVALIYHLRCAETTSSLGLRLKEKQDGSESGYEVSK